MSLISPAASSNVLALVTTVHLALSALRNHRQAGNARISSLAVVSTLLAGLPWLFPSPAGLAAGVFLHVIWYAACERFAPRAPVVAPTSVRRAVTPPPATSRPDATNRPRGFVQAPVLAVIDEAPDVRTFRFARPGGFEFTAGQFLTIRVQVDGRELVRCYSISSSPAARGYLDISVKRQGVVSNVLHATLRPAALVSIKAPAGAFVYPANDDRPLLLLAGGIGITPLLSMLRHATESEPARQVTLLYSVRREEYLAFRDEIAALVRRHPQVRAVFAATEAPASTHVYPGRIDEALVTTTMPNVRDAIALICGPQPMIDGMRQLLSGLGMPDPQIRYERFEAAVASVGAKATDATHGAATSTTRHQMRCTRTGSAVPVAAGQSILEAAEAGGIQIDSLCRSGVCGTCRTRVVDGEVDCDSTALDDADREQGYVLACVSRVLSDCTVEA